MSENPVSAVLDPDYKKPFTVIIAIVTLISVAMMGIGYIERVVDGRIDIKLTAQKQQVEDHEKRLSKIEEKLGGMSDVLAEIRSDVKVLRVQMEKR